MDIGQCRCWSVCCSLVMSFIVGSLLVYHAAWSMSLLVSVLFVCYFIRSWFVVGRPWALVNVVVGQCVVRWLLCHSSFVVGSLLVDHGPWSMSLLVSVLFVGCYVIRRS